MFFIINYYRYKTTAAYCRSSMPKRLQEVDKIPWEGSSAWIVGESLFCCWHIISKRDFIVGASCQCLLTCISPKIRMTLAISRFNFVLCMFCHRKHTIVALREGVIPQKKLPLRHARDSPTIVGESAWHPWYIYIHPVQPQRMQCRERDKKCKN